MGLLLNGRRDLVTKTIRSAKVLNAFFAFIPLIKFIFAVENSEVMKTLLLSREGLG